MGKSSILLKAAAITSSVSSASSSTTSIPTTKQIRSNVATMSSSYETISCVSAATAAAAATTATLPIDFEQSCYITDTSSRRKVVRYPSPLCDTVSVEPILSVRGGSTDDATSSSRDKFPRKQQRRTSPNESKTEQPSTTKSSTTKPSNIPKKKTTKASSSRIVNEIMKETDYYKILGLEREDMVQQQQHRADGKNLDQIIQKAYRKRALQTHPDKTNGDRRAFDKVAEAYDVLQDEQKRTIYNKYGKRGLESGMGNAGGSGMGGMNGGMAPEDLFRSFFGGTGSANPFGSFGQQQQQSRNRSMRFEVDVTLEDVYAGKTMKVMLPGSQTPIDLSIPRGSYHNENIIASGAIDNDSQQPPGDAYFRIKVRPHATFTSKGYDLAIQIDITLTEAITGVSRTIRHLDGRTMRVISAPASTNCESGPIVIATGDVHILKGEGMPKNTMGTEFGDLYIQYQVNIPKNKGIHTKDRTASTLTEAERCELERLLNKLEGKSVDKKVHWPFKSYKDGKVMKQASASDFGKNGPRIDDSSSSSSPFGAFGESSGFPGNNPGFFWSSTTSGSSTGSSSSSSSNNPFGQHVPSDDDGTQCRQM